MEPDEVNLQELAEWAENNDLHARHVLHGAAAQAAAHALLERAGFPADALAAIRAASSGAVS